MKRWLLLALCLFKAFPVMAQTSYVPATRLLYPKGYQFSLGADVFQTSKTVTPNGTTNALPEDESFTRYQADANLLYGAAQNFQVGVGTRYRHHNATMRSGDEEVNASGSGLQSVYAGFSYAFEPWGPLSYNAEAIYRYTPYDNEKVSNVSENNLIIGDDGNEYSVGLALTYAFKSNNFLTARGGYRNPGGNLSEEIYWQVEGAMGWKHLALLAGVDGITSLRNDPFENNRPTLNTGNSALYNSSNRELMAPYVGINLALGTLWRVEFKASEVMAGRSTDLGRAYGIQLIRRVEENSTKAVDARFKTYDIEANVTKVSPKKTYVVIDKGLAEGIQKGISMDIFEFDYVGGNVLVARGTVVQAKADSAIIKLTQRFNQKKEIKEGLLARGVLK